MFYRLITNQRSPWSISFPKELVVAHLVQKYSLLMDPKDIVPYSQKHITGPYPKPDESNLKFILYLLNINLNLVLSSTCRCSGLASSSYPSCLPIQILRALLVILQIRRIPLTSGILRCLQCECWAVLCHDMC
jgi:hypothetical protein